MMHGHLHQILDVHFSSEAVGTQFTTRLGTFTPENELGQLRARCERTLEFNSEYGASIIAEHFSGMVKHIYHALTGTDVDFDGEQCTKHGEVVTDHLYRGRDDKMIKVLWEDKSPAAFTKFIRPLEEQTTAHESVAGLWSESSTITFDGYKATLGKVRAVVSVSGLRFDSSLPLADLPCN